MSLKISRELALPDNAVTSTMVIYGGKGMGKTNCGAVIAEECKRVRKRFAVIDPMGVWWGLQHATDGKGPGIEVLVLGGKHGDIPIEPIGGMIVADLVADEDVDVVIDISRRPDGKMWSVNERIRFVTDYITRLYERQGERSRPLLQIIDEAGRFCPQVIPTGRIDLSKCVGAIECMVEEGRNVGIGTVLLTQRSARMNKSVSELADCMVAFRTVGPRSVDAILDWLGEHIPKERWKDLVDKLRKLPVGSALVVSPGWLDFEGVVAMRARETFDSSKTPTGQERRTSGKAAKPDLTKYQARMAEVIDRVEAQNPAKLRARIVTLEKELATKVSSAKPVTIHVEPKRVEVPVLRSKEAQRIEKAARSFEASAKVVAELGANVLTAIANISKVASLSKGPPAFGPVIIGMGAGGAGSGGPSSHVTPVHVPGPRAVIQKTHKVPPRGDDGWRPGRCEMALLAVLAQRQGLPTSAIQLSVLSGYSITSSSFTNALGALRSHGAVLPPKGSEAMWITDCGLSLGPPPAPLPTGAAVIDYWVAKLQKAEGAVLRVIWDAHPKELSKSEVAKAADYSETSSSYTNAVGAIRSLGLVVKGTHRLSDAMASAKEQG